MAHVLKSTKESCGGLTRHYERSKKENGEYQNFSNQEIDLSRSHLNYNLAPEREGGQLEFIRQRTSEVKCLKRDDVNVMCSWVVTAPEGLATHIEQREGQRPLFHFKGEKAQEDLQLFFEESYKFLNARYGHNTDKNVISAYVHMDEKTPHMHYAFVPVVIDRKKGYEKVSASEVIHRYDLQKFHPDLERRMAVVFGREIGILNEATKDGNKTVEELKQEAKVIESRIAVSRAEKIEIEAEKNHLEAEKTQLEKEVVPIRELKRLKIKTEEIPIPQKTLIGNKPNMPYEAAVKAVEGNNAYIANEVEIKSIRANRAKLKKREDDVAKRETAADGREQQLATKEKSLGQKSKYLAEKEKQIESMYSTQAHLNQLYEQQTTDLSDLWTKHNNLKTDFEQAQNTTWDLKAKINALQAHLSQVGVNYQKEIQTLQSGLKTQLKDTYDYVSAIIQAIQLLKYNYANNQPNPYKAQLTDKQSRLIDAITNYASEKAKHNNLDDIAENMKTVMGLTPGMEKHVKDLEPKPKIERGLSR